MKLIGDAFINMIQRFRPEAKPASNRTEIIIKCPFCGDSDGRHNHCYISVPQNERELSLYDCKRAVCGAHGILTETVLRKIGCYEPEFLIALTQHNSAVMKLPTYQRIKDIDIFPLANHYITDNKFSLIKLKYINERLGINLTYDDLLKLKIFLNLNDVLELNRLPITREEYVVQQLNSHFIGFISFDNSFANMRQVFSKNILPQINYKYINYRLADKIDESKNYYTIPSHIDLSNPMPVNIHVAEGVFDILGIYFHICKENNMQNIYITAGGKSYNQALEFALEQSGAINYNLHIYPDNDVNDNQLNWLVLRHIKLLPGNIYIHRNKYPNTKDYGVPANQIHDSVYQVMNNAY